jgi:hypothetical protein
MGRQDRPFVCAATPATHVVPMARLTHPVTDLTASPKVARTLHELGFKIKTA